MTPETPAVKPQQRECLPCTACCDGWVWAQINEFTVKAGHPCPHSTNNGCSIYADRPENPCRIFVCGWRADQHSLPDSMRPDISGAIVQLAVPWEGESVISAVPVGVEIPQATLEWLFAYARNHRRPLVYFHRLMKDGEYIGLKRLGYGPAGFREKVTRMGLQTQHAILDMSGGESRIWAADQPPDVDD